MKFLVIIPVYNEAESLKLLLPCLPIDQDFEYLVVDDCSVDSSGQIVRASGLEVLSLPTNQGKPRAVKAGFNQALTSDFEAVIVMDGDGQHAPEYLWTIKRYLQSFPVVKGSRFHAQSKVIGQIPKDRLAINRAVKSVLAEFIGWQVTDPQCGFLGLSRRALEVLYPLLDFDEEFEIELLVWLWHLTKGKDFEFFYEFPIPAIYDLSVSKQKAKYQEDAWPERLEERLLRQVRKVISTVKKCQELDESSSFKEIFP